MPELPEVQVVVDDLKRVGIVGQTICTVQVSWPRIIAVPEPEAFCRMLLSQHVTDVWRRGKFLVFSLSKGGFLCVHLRMTGHLYVAGKTTGPSKHEHVTLGFENGREFRFRDTRKFGRMYLVEDLDRIVGHLGPEPLGRAFTDQLFYTALRRRRRMLKPLLLDQRFVAGLGNIYVDEALWDARIHPCRIAASLSRAEALRLHRAITVVLRRGIKHRGTTLGGGLTGFSSVQRSPGRNRNHLQVFRRQNLPCPRCREQIQRLRVAQRSTHICPRCQLLSSLGSKPI